MARPDIILIKPSSRKQVFGDLTGYAVTAIEPPLWAALLAGYLRGLGYGVELLDAEALNLGPQETARAVEDLDPWLAAFVVSGTNPSASTITMDSTGEALRAVQERVPGAVTALMGLHPSALPERTLREAQPDYVIQGEGFRTLPALIDALKAGERTPAIDGLWYLESGVARSNPRPAVLPDLDILPRPAWDLLPMGVYRAHNWHCLDDISVRQPYTVLYTSLGCPFKCSFCCINSLFGRSGIRYRGIESVLDELEWLAENVGVRKVKILDEMFALGEERVVSLCNKIAERGLNLDMWAYARVNTVNRRMLDAMKAAGINWAAYGFEAADERVLAASSKGYGLDEVGRVVEMTREAGMHICANFVFGLPEDDYDSMQASFTLMQDINAEWANIYAAMAYPGSKLHEEAVLNGWPLPDTWKGYSQYSYETLPLPTKTLSGGQVLAFRDYAFDAYYGSPRYLDKIEKTFGIETSKYIVSMAKRKMKRKFLATY